MNVLCTLIVTAVIGQSWSGSGSQYSRSPAFGGGGFQSGMSAGSGHSGFAVRHVAILDDWFIASSLEFDDNEKPPVERRPLLKARWQMAREQTKLDALLRRQAMEHVFRRRES